MAGMGAGVGVPDTNQAVITPSIDILDEQGSVIGYVTRLDRTDRRPVDPIRHLSSKDAGRKLEGSPHVEDTTLSITGFALYSPNATSRNSLLNRLPQSVDGASAFVCLNSQKIPFVICEKTVHPANPNKVLRTYYLGCWLTQYGRPINIGNVNIAETAEVFVQAVVSSVPA